MRREIITVRTTPKPTALMFLLPALAVAGSASAAQPRVLTLDQAVRQAIAQNPRLRGARSATASQGDQALSVRGHLLPLVDVSMMYSDVNSPEDVQIGELLGPFLPKPSGAGASGQSGPSIPSELPLKGIQAGLGTVTVAQPLLGLWHLSHDYAAASDQADSAQDDLRAAEADLREQVEDGFIALFEARALRGIAQASYDQLGDQLRLTDAKFKDGVLTRADVLRVQVAVANADQQRIQAGVQEDVARAALLTLLGMSPETTEVDFAEPTDLERRPIPTDVTDAESFADQHRAEIQSAQAGQSAAHHAFVSSELKILPEINASATYIRVQGMPAGLPPDYFMVGVNLDWPIWEWGASYYAARAASERDDAATARVDGVRDQVALEVHRRLREERAAANAVTVAQDAIAQAEEAFRVTEAMVRAGSATTTDLLDAQSALTQARLNLVRAKYQDLRARSALTRALGA